MLSDGASVEVAGRSSIRCFLFQTEVTWSANLPRTARIRFRASVYSQYPASGFKRVPE
jgi:hypothetical protein